MKCSHTMTSNKCHIKPACVSTATATTTAVATTDKPICNICRQEDQPDNFLKPCACRGTIGFVHYKCIKIWIETSGSDLCTACKKPYATGLSISKRAGRFGKFFYHSDMGRLYSQFCYFFLVMFYLSYLGQFHCRLAYLRGWITSAMMITVFNTFYLIIETVLFTVFLAIIFMSFTTWRKTHFEIQVDRPVEQQAVQLGPDA